MRQSSELNREAAPDATTLLKFRHLLEAMKPMCLVILTKLHPENEKRENNAKNAAIQTENRQIPPENPKTARRALLHGELFSVSLNEIVSKRYFNRDHL
jgi:hypothetical protein